MINERKMQLSSEKKKTPVKSTAQGSTANAEADNDNNKVTHGLI